MVYFYAAPVVDFYSAVDTDSADAIDDSGQHLLDVWMSHGDRVISLYGSLPN